MKKPNKRIPFDITPHFRRWEKIWRKAWAPLTDAELLHLAAHVKTRQRNEACG